MMHLGMAILDQEAPTGKIGEISSPSAHPISSKLRILFELVQRVEGILNFP